MICSVTNCCKDHINFHMVCESVTALSVLIMREKVISGMTAEACKRDTGVERMKEISQSGRKQLTRLHHSDIGVQTATAELRLLPVSGVLTDYSASFAIVLFLSFVCLLKNGWEAHVTHDCRIFFVDHSEFLELS